MNKMTNPYFEHFMAVVGEGSAGSDNGDDIGYVYRTVPYQRGYGWGYHEMDYMQTHGLGFGETIASLFNFAKPLVTKGLKFLGTTAVDTAANIAQDAISGENVGSAAKRRLTDAAEDIFARAPDVIMENVFKNRGSNRKRFIQPSAGELVASARRRGHNKKKRITGRGLFDEYPALEKIV